MKFHWYNLLTGFEPTYKELKRTTLEIKGNVQQCFEPTYKELKRALGHLDQNSGVCFEPTYKELKRENRWGSEGSSVSF